METNIRILTLENLKDNLNKFGKSALVRPTGFGKTFMLSGLIKQYKNVLFLYPTDVVKNSVIRYYMLDVYKRLPTQEEYQTRVLDHITFMTYMGLIRLEEADFAIMNYDLVIMDEVHKIGAERTKAAISELTKHLKGKAHFVGSTATPDRSDGYDVMEQYFGNINVQPYTLHDAFQDGLIQKPYYVYFSWNVKNKITKDTVNEILRVEREFDTVMTDEEKRLLKRKQFEIANMFKVEDIIGKVCKEQLDTNYMKFICFFSSFASKKKLGEQVKNWFKTAFPEHTQRITEITSESVDLKDTSRLEKLDKQDNLIDLIFCVDMLNMGYHVNSISGILMLRETQSNIIYAQQLGRSLSSGNNEHCVVFDLVDNIKRGSIFDDYVRDDYGTIRDRHIEEGKYNPIKTLLDKDGNPRLNEKGEPITYDAREYCYDESIDNIRYRWEKDASTIHPQDILGTGVIASYRTLIKRTVVDQLLQRANVVFTSHLRYWCEEHNENFPLTDKEAMEMYNQCREDFNKSFKNMLEDNQLTYPLHDREKLLDANFDLFAHQYGMNSEKILDEMGV